MRCNSHVSFMLFTFQVVASVRHESYMHYLPSRVVERIKWNRACEHVLQMFVVIIPTGHIVYSEKTICRLPRVAYLF